LRHIGVFSYSEELAAAIDSEKELAYSSEFEIELRAATVITVEKIMQFIKECGGKISTQVHYAYQVDWILWQLGEAKLDEMKPHHRVLSIFY
jgi:hypothetical protein